MRAKLNLFIRPEYEKTRRMTGFEFLSNVGGLLVFVVFLAQPLHLLQVCVVFALASASYQELKFSTGLSSELSGMCCCCKFE